VKPKALVQVQGRDSLPPQILAPQVSMKEWLTEIDPNGELIRYRRELCANFDSVAHVLDAYGRDGVLSSEFFEDMGIQQAAHREIIEQWFRDLVERQGDIREDEQCPYQLPEQLDEGLAPLDSVRPDGLPDPERRPKLTTETFQKLESDDEEDEGEHGSRPKGWARALELLARVGLSETLWERALEHLEQFQKGRLGGGGFQRSVRREAEDSDEDGASSDGDAAADEEARACYNATLKTCEEGWKWEESLLLLSEMRKHVAPDEHSYTAAVGACAAERQWSHALSLLGQMRGDGIYPKTVTYNAAIWSLEEEGAPWERAISVLEEMRNLGAGRQPSALTYTAAINVLAAHGRWEEALLVLEDMRALRVKPDVGTYRAIKEADWGCEWPVEKALGVLDKMQRAAKS